MDQGCLSLFSSHIVLCKETKGFGDGSEVSSQQARSERNSENDRWFRVLYSGGCQDLCLAIEEKEEAGVRNGSDYCWLYL